MIFPKNKAVAYYQYQYSNSDIFSRTYYIQKETLFIY